MLFCVGRIFSYPRNLGAIQNLKKCWNFLHFLNIHINCKQNRSKKLPVYYYCKRRHSLVANNWNNQIKEKKMFLQRFNLLRNKTIVLEVSLWLEILRRHVCLRTIQTATTTIYKIIYRKKYLQRKILDWINNLRRNVRAESIFPITNYCCAFSFLT